jgi:hypothetical protein
MRATITNLSPRAREKVLVTTFPSKLAYKFPNESTFKTDEGFQFRAVRSGKRGSNTEIFRIFANIDGNEKLKGTLIPQSHKDADISFKYHKWVADDFRALLPNIGVVDDGQISNSVTWTSNLDIQELTLVEKTNVHHRWFLRVAMPSTGLVFEWWADINHDDPVIQFWGKVIWSDREDPRESKKFKHLLLRSGEFVSLDFRKNLGSSNPQKIDGKWQVLLGSDIEMRDGGGIPLVGSMLAFVGPGGIPVDPEIDDKKDFESLLAALGGPVNGVCHEWDGQWLANKWIPRRSDVAQMHLDAKNELARFQSKMQQTEGWGALTMVGIQNNPGTTGDQEDFGATKGIYAVSTRDPRHIQLYQQSIYNDLYRGFMHYEVIDGKTVPLDIERHPNWITWSGRTHWHTGVSPDRLGKTESNPFGDEWKGYDDQHRSQNNLAAYIQLSDDPLAMDIINHITTTDMASYRVRFRSPGAARAQGRMAGCLANFLTLVDDGKVKNDIIKHLNLKFEVIEGLDTYNFPGAVKVIGYNGPDGRKPIFDANGDLLPTWSVWEHGLALVGLYNAHKANPTALSEEVLTTLFGTIVDQGCFEADDGWWLVSDQWYRNGEPIPGGLHKDNTFLDYGRGGVNGWTKAAIMGAAEFLPAGPLKDKAIACSIYFSNGQDPDNAWEDEWWCVVESQDM